MDNKTIELHTIATFQGEEYELENLMNGILEKIEEKDKEIERLNNIIDEKDTEITILKNKLDMIKNNVDDLIKRKDKQAILDIIEIYTGFWGKGDESE